MENELGEMVRWRDGEMDFAQDKRCPRRFLSSHYKQVVNKCLKE